MSNLNQGDIAVEYTRGTGAEFPAFSSISGPTTIASATATANVQVVSTLPASGTSGDLCFVTGPNHLYVFTTSWVQVV